MKAKRQSSSRMAKKKAAGLVVPNMRRDEFPAEHPYGLDEDEPGEPLDLTRFIEDVELPEEILPFQGM